MKMLIRYTFLPLFVGLLIFVATCLLTPSQMPEMPKGVPWDKLVHFGMFFLLSAVALVDYYRLHKGAPSLVRWILWGFIIPVIYGGAIELVQKYFFPLRSGEWNDWFADILGALVATLIVIIFVKKR